MNTHNLNICLLPLEIKWEEKDYNLSQLEEKFALVKPGTDLVVLPETFSTGFPSGEEKDHVRDLAERNTGETIERLKVLARHFNVALAGTFIADTGGSLYNRAFFIEPSGDEYFADKRHLFTMAGENKVFSKGYDRMNLRYRGWNISMIVCYDIRFPVWCRNRRNEYDLLLAVANWPVARVDAWEKLLYARAIENEAYIAGVNCRGVDRKGYEYNGSSAVIDFKGKLMTQGIDADGFIYATLSRESLEKFREKFPAWNDADDYTLSR